MKYHRRVGHSWDRKLSEAIFHPQGRTAKESSPTPALWMCVQSPFPARVLDDSTTLDDPSIYQSQRLVDRHLVEGWGWVVVEYKWQEEVPGQLKHMIVEHHPYKDAKAKEDSPR